MEELSPILKEFLWDITFILHATVRYLQYGHFMIKSYKIIILNLTILLQYLMPLKTIQENMNAEEEL